MVKLDLKKLERAYRNGPRNSDQLLS
jgi:hypothetical protein